MIVFRNPERLPSRTLQPAQPVHLCGGPRADERRIPPSDLPDGDFADEDLDSRAMIDRGAGGQESVTRQMLLGLVIAVGIGGGFWAAIGWSVARLLR